MVSKFIHAYYQAKVESLDYTRDKSVGCCRSSILAIMTEYRSRTIQTYKDIPIS